MRGKKLLSLLLSAALVGTMLPTAALAAEDSGADNDPLVCTTDEGCAAEIHEENCPLYETPKEENEEPLVLETIPTETVPPEENALASTPVDAEGNETVPGWVDENDGHSKQIAETFDFVVDGIAYSIVDGGVEVSRWYWKWAHSCDDKNHTITVHAGSLYTGKEIEIPATVTYKDTEYDVVGIGVSAFYNANNYTVSMPENSSAFTYIGDQVFFETSPKMESITIPASVTHIGKKSFALNEDSIPVIIPEDSRLQVIGDQAFANNSAITELNLPDTLTTIGSQAFSKCTSLTSITIPASVTDIQTDTFDGYYNADNGEENVAFAEGSIFKLQDGVLYDTENLIRVLDWRENVAVPDGIKYIGADAFNAYDPKDDTNSNVLKSITLPDSLVSIGKSAFQSCKALESITIPKNVTEIGSGAFSGCSSLATVDIQAPLTELTGSDGGPTGIFNGCSALSNLTLPKSITVIGDRTFSGCTSLAEFDFSNITKIGTEAFKKTGLTSFIGADNLTELGENVFQECSNLKTVIIPDAVTNIPTATFGLCGNLETVIVHEGVKSFGISAFNGAFSSSGGTLIMKGENAPTIGQYAFNMQNTVPDGLTVYYPAASKEAYQTAGLIDEENTNGYALNLIDASMILATAKAANGNTLTLKTVTVPEGMTLEATSSNTGVATVTGESGKLVVTGVADGTATITATLKVDDYVVLTDSCTVTVTAAGTVIPDVEEPQVSVDDSISDDTDKETATKVAGSVSADEVVSSAAQKEAGNLNTSAEKENLIEKGKEELKAQEGDTVTLFTQSFLEIKAEKVDKSDSKVSAITLNITPKVQVVASTATNSADIQIKDEDGKGNAVVVKPAEELEITTSAKITVELPADTFVGKTVYVKHGADSGTYFYSAEADGQGTLTFTSKHGFSPFTFSLTNEAVAEVNGVGYASFQAAVDAAGQNGTVKVLTDTALNAKISGSSKTIYVENATNKDSISVTINGDTFTVAKGQSEEYTYTKPSGGGGSSGGGDSDPTYSISTPDKVTGGSIKVTPNRASAGTRVTITAKPSSGYELDELTVTDSKGNELKVTDRGDNKYTFQMPNSKVEIEVSFTKIEETPKPDPSTGFVDVPANAYYADAVEWAVSKGITSGTSATTFSPDMSCTRAQMVTFLWRAAGSPAPKSTVNPFVDIQSGAYYYDAVLWAVEQGITSGTSATTFAPDATVTRGQTVTFLYRAAGSPAVTGGSFADVAADAYYADAVAWAVSENITAGTGNGLFAPDTACTRAQIVTFLYRAEQ